MQTHFATHRLTWQGGLYAACPILLASLFGLNLVLPSHWAVSAFYSVAIVAAVPTWDPRFIRETSVATVLLVLWNAVARHEGGANLTALLLNSVLGLLTAWAVLRLSLDIVGASALRARAQPAPLPLAHPDCARQGSLITMCAWTKRVKDGGHWVSIEEFLDRHLHLVVSHGVSDELKASLIAHQDVARRPQAFPGNNVPCRLPASQNLWIRRLRTGIRIGPSASRCSVSHYSPASPRGSGWPPSFMARKRDHGHPPPASPLDRASTVPPASVSSTQLHLWTAGLDRQSGSSLHLCPETHSRIGDLSPAFLLSPRDPSATACERSRSESTHQRTTPCIFETRIPPWCRVRNALVLP